MAPGDGHADADEIQTILKRLDLPWHKSDVMKLIAEVDRDGNGTVEFDEFLWMIKKLQGALPLCALRLSLGIRAATHRSSPINLAEEHGELKSSSFGAALSGLGKQLFSGSLFKKKNEFDTEKYSSANAERAREVQEIEERLLSKEAKKKLEQARRNRAATTKN